VWRRRFACASALALSTLFSASAHAQLPSRIVTIVVPYAAGGGTDALTRFVAKGLEQRLGQPVIIENRGGSGTTTGGLAVARAEPDGYTLLFTPALVLSVLPQARGGSETGYKPDSLAPVCQTFVNTMGLAVRPDSPLKSVADLVAAAKQRPGQLNYGHPGVLTIPHLAMEELQQTAGVDTKDIPFRTGPQSITELLGGRLDFVSLVMGTEVGQNIRIIAVFGEKRIATFPDVPTVKEQGYDVVPVSFGGLLAPLSTPEPVQSRLRAACRDAAKDDIYVITAKRAGQPDDRYLDAAEFRQRLQSDIASKARVLSRLKTP
jgi:tripartite-type tricarboxylate transporter receptor subunit TctC